MNTDPCREALREARPLIHSLVCWERNEYGSATTRTAGVLTRIDAALAALAQPVAVREPLTEEQIHKITGCRPDHPLWLAISEVVRATERAHGIGTQEQP